jgi:hypothetical protein
MGWKGNEERDKVRGAKHVVRLLLPGRKAPRCWFHSYTRLKRRSKQYIALIYLALTYSIEKASSGIFSRELYQIPRDETTKKLSSPILNTQESLSF